MKFLSPQIARLAGRRDARQKRATLFRFLALLGTAIAVYSFLFHVLMAHEGQDHSWLTGLYWTLTVMSTLGFGDITFHSDPGRIFSIVVLLSGIALLLIVGPLVVIQTVAGPWLEDQLRHQAPHEVALGTSGHVIVCQFDEVAAALGEALREHEIPYFFIEPDPVKAAALFAEDVPVIVGDRDAEGTYEAMRVSTARVVVSNLSDPENSNVALTIRQSHPNVPIFAFADEPDSVDVLELSGANEVLPLKVRLGESLATRVTAGTAHAHPVGRFKDLVIVEFPMEHTGLAGRTIQDTNLRKLTGLNIVACWEAGRLLPARPNTVLGEHSVLVLVGTNDQIAELDAMFAIYHPNENPVIVIGGGKVGQATVRALGLRGVSVCMIERNEGLRSTLEGLSDRLLIGDATDRRVVMQAGLEQTPCVVLTANDDAINIFLSVYCRRLAPDVHIVSRITGLRNLEAIHRAGADQVLSETTLAVHAIVDQVRGSETSIMAEGVDIVIEPVPAVLHGKRIEESGIADLTGLNVIALQRRDGSIISPQASTELQTDHELVMLGSREQRESFRQQFS